jgi:chemotaxis protein methyltransferase CheR
VEVTVKEEDIEILINDLLEIYGYDFTEYSRASLRRRINRLHILDKFPSFAEFRYKVRSDEDYLKRVVEELTVNVTEMFRDPSFYKTLREDVLPVLATHPFIRIWHAGVSTGEEIYSMAILLHEAKLLHKSLLYGTDINPGVLDKAGKGIFPLEQMKQYSENYILSGGLCDFSSYYTARYNQAKFSGFLSEDMIFSTHNLVSDRSFNEFQLILCRNVLIYFDRDLQNKVFKLFDNSLELFGFLALGSKETVKFSQAEKKFKLIKANEKIWRKIA